MLSGKLLPAHPHPYPGECFSSWLLRVAHANGLKAQTFCDLIFGKKHQIWNRDIDRSVAPWMLEIICDKTGAKMKTAIKTTLKFYEGRLFSRLHPASQLRWVLPLKMYHRRHLGYGMQYCPMCLAEDKEPYYRLAWRLALYTFCPIHKVLLLDRCPHCFSSIEPHRIELGKPNLFDVENMDLCWCCDAKLSATDVTAWNNWCNDVMKVWFSVLRAIEFQFVNGGPINFGRLLVLHQVCKILNSSKFSIRLISYICDKTGLEALSCGSCSTFEQHPHYERHFLLELAWWLVGRTPRKLKTAISSKAFRINHIYRDLSLKEKEIVLNYIFH